MDCSPQCGKHCSWRSVYLVCKTPKSWQGDSHAGFRSPRCSKPFTGEDSFNQHDSFMRPRKVRQLVHHNNTSTEFRVKPGSLVPELHAHQKERHDAHSKEVEVLPPLALFSSAPHLCALEPHASAPRPDKRDLLAETSSRHRIRIPVNSQGTAIGMVTSSTAEFSQPIIIFFPQSSKSAEHSKCGLQNDIFAKNCFLTPGGSPLRC